MKTMLSERLSRFRFSSLRNLSPSRYNSVSSVVEEIQPTPPVTPQFQMEYTVCGSDTLERIAASNDCTVGELMKLNRMSSRTVFPGQKIVVPLSSSDDVFESNSMQAASIDDGIRKAPGGAVPARSNLTKTASAPTGSVDDTDSDCLQRFLKIKVKQVTESDGTVSGTLLVTPNCLMFDPDVSHPLVKENGQDLYGMVANLDEIMSVSVYKEIGALTGDKSEKKREIFDPDHIRTPPTHSKANLEETSSNIIEKNEVPTQNEVKFSCDASVSDSEGYDSAIDDVQTKEDVSGSPRLGSEIFLPAITEEAKGGVDSPDDERRRAVSDLSHAEGIEVRQRHSVPHSNPGGERPRSFSELETGSQAQGLSRFSPMSARRSFGKLGRTLSARAKSVSNSVTQGAEKVAQTAVQGTKTVAHGVVTHTKSAADTLQTGIETSVKAVGEAANAAANQAKAAADAVASVPTKVVDLGSSLVSEGINGMQDMFVVEEQRSVSQMKREQSLATLEGLKQRTQQARDEAVKNKSMFSCATSTEEMPDLFIPVDEMISSNRSDSAEGVQSPQLPYYMAVRLTRNTKKPKRYSPSGNPSTSEEDCSFGNRLKREFWFAVPRNKADNIYHFLLQWSPEKYGQDTTTVTLEESVEVGEKIRNDKSFIILDSSADESLTGEKPSFGSSLLNREWELVTVSEMCRRLSLDEIERMELPVPEGAEASQILDELMIRQIMEILPPRAEGYPWVSIYNSEKHGFSLSTLYRKMIEFDEDLSPVLLIIRDTNEHVFGAVVSGAIRPSDHYNGTGDSSLLWRFTGIAPHTRELRQYNWTGNNQFFVSALKDSLSIGAGGGHFGIWLDADLNHGRSQRCETFDNEPLSGEKEDFVVQFIEAFGFRM